MNESNRTVRSHELTPGEVARRAGVAVSALHFYEREGLITSIRTAGNQRRYHRDVLRRIAFVRVSQGVGISLADNATLNSLASLRTGKVDDPNAIDPSVLAVTKGGLSDPNAANASPSASASGKKPPPKKK